VSVAEEANRTGEVIEVPAQPVKGDDSPVEPPAGGLLVAVDAFVAGGGD
jgi:hypothetical protein